MRSLSRVEEIIRKAKKGKGKLEEVLEQRKDLLATSLQESQVERMIEEDRRRAVEERRKRQKTEAGVEESQSPMQMILGFLASQGLKGEDAAKFMKALDEETIMKLNMLSSSPQGQNALLPLMLFGRQPQTTVKDMSEISKGYVDTAVKLVETMRPKEEKKEGVGEPFITLFSKTLDELKETRLQMMQKDIGNLEKKIEEARVDPRAYLKSIREDAELLGLGRREGLSDDAHLKAVEIQTGVQLQIEKMRMEHEDRLMGIQAEREKWNAIRETFAPMLAIGAQPIAEGLRKVGRTVGSQIQRGTPPAQTPPTGTGPTISIPCPQCQTPLSFMPPYPEEVKCPHCGLERSFVELMTPPGQRPAEKQTSRRARLRPKYG